MERKKRMAMTRDAREAYDAEKKAQKQKRRDEGEKWGDQIAEEVRSSEKYADCKHRMIIVPSMAKPSNYDKAALSAELVAASSLPGLTRQSGKHATASEQQKEQAKQHGDETRQQHKYYNRDDCERDFPLAWGAAKHALENLFGEGNVMIQQNCSQSPVVKVLIHDRSKSRHPAHHDSMREGDLQTMTMVLTWAETEEAVR